MVKVRCVCCKREKMVPTEGRIIDGSWVEDKYLSKYRGRWVCSYGCYQKLLEKEVVKDEN